MPDVRGHFLPELVCSDDLAGRVAVVVDVLRATTTIVAALAAGARAVVPCLTIDEARRVASALPPGTALLGGERGGLAIEGFDLGNSPAEYTSQAVTGKTIVLTTTNGTKALVRCRGASQVVLAAFVNFSGVCEYLLRIERPTLIDIVCAGTDSHQTQEDVLLAGALAGRLADAAGWQLDDGAAMARAAWSAVSRGDDDELPSRVIATLRDSRGGRNLIAIGMDRDIETAAEIDRFNIVPRFDPSTGAVTI